MLSLALKSPLKWTTLFYHSHIYHKLFYALKSPFRKKGYFDNSNKTNITNDNNDDDDDDDDDDDEKDDNDDDEEYEEEEEDGNDNNNRNNNNNNYYCYLQPAMMLVEQLQKHVLNYNYIHGKYTK